MTIAFGQLAWFIAIRLRGITKGEDGLLNLQRLPADLAAFSFDLQSERSFYYFTVVVFVLVVVGLWIVVQSPFGSVIQAIRQNEKRAAFAGYSVRSLKWVSFSLSAAISGLAGGLFALAQRSAFPDVMALHWSGIIVMMTIVGGGLVSFLGTGAGRDLLFPDSGHHRRGHRDVAPVVRPGVPAGHPVPARGARRDAPAGPFQVLGARGGSGDGGGGMRIRGFTGGGRAPLRGLDRSRASGDSPAGPLFEATGIHKRFGWQVVLERVDLRFESHRLSGIIGPNGAGKTTPLQRPDRRTAS